eukprot:1264676-Amorphochlora_amoeboformis.AAC.1
MEFFLYMCAFLLLLPCGCAAYAECNSSNVEQRFYSSSPFWGGVVYSTATVAGRNYAEGVRCSMTISARRLVFLELCLDTLDALTINNATHTQIFTGGSLPPSLYSRC